VCVCVEVNARFKDLAVAALLPQLQGCVCVHVCVYVCVHVCLPVCLLGGIMRLDMWIGG